MNLKDVKFTLNKSIEENLSLMQEAMMTFTDKDDRHLINNLYTHYSRTVPSHFKFMKYEEDKLSKKDQLELPIEFGVVEGSQGLKA